jgi:hypothetical protein
MYFLAFHGLRVPKEFYPLIIKTPYLIKSGAAFTIFSEQAPSLGKTPAVGTAALPE